MSIAPGRATSVTRAVAVVERVLDQRVERALEVGGGGVHGRCGGAGRGAHASVEAGGGRAGGGAEVDLLGGRVGLARLGEQQQLGDHRGEAVDLLERGLDLLGVAGGARLLEPQLQAGERGAELVRGVGDELALAVDQALEPRAHLVERAREALLLGGALDRHAGVQVALAEAGGGVVEAAQRAGDLAGDQRAGAEAEQEHEDADRDEAVGSRCAWRGRRPRRSG